MAKKIGRNEPCPCGSGKKHKRCCLGKDGALPAAAPVAEGAEGSRQQEGQSLAAAPATGWMTPYTAAKLFEESEVFAEMKRREPAKARLYWTTSMVKALATEELVAKLQDLGIDASRQRFVALAQRRWSAWSLSDRWRGRCRGLSRHDDGFLGLAACELWARYCPERPSIEMLDDWMQEGYELSRQRQGPQACDRWAQVWAVIAERLRPEMRTCESAREVFNGTELLFNWIQEYQLELYNAALDDDKYAQAGVAFAEAVLAQFTDEESNFRLNLRCDLGMLYFLAGRPEQGERLFLDLIDELPDKCAGYVNLADALSLRARRSNRPADRARALELLEQARAKPVTDGADYDLDERIDYFRKLAAEAPDQAPTT